MMDLISIGLGIIALIFVMFGLREEYLVYKRNQDETKAFKEEMSKVLDECYSRTKDERFINIKATFLSGK